MDKKELIKKINKVDNLIIKIKTDSYVIPDGIVNVERYINVKYKILWILKEPNDKGENEHWDMRDLINDHAIKREKLNPDMASTFPKIIYSSYSILNDFISWEKMTDFREDISMIDILKSIALINIRKLSGKSKSNDDVIQDAYWKYREIILKQIEVFNPDIIIGGNTIKYFNPKDLNLDDFEKYNKFPIDYYVSKERIIIDAYHPAYFTITQDDYCNSIIKAVKKWVMEFKG